MSSIKKLSKYEQEFVAMLSSMNEDMGSFAEQDLMSEHAYNQLSMVQKDQMTKIKMMFRHMKSLCESEYYKQRVERADTSLRKKRLTEQAKRADAVIHPDRYDICPCCDSIFTNKTNLARHRRKTLKCAVIKCSKKGALACANHRAPESISAYINDHINDEDTDEEVEAQIQDDINEENGTHGTAQMVIPTDIGQMGDQDIEGWIQWQLEVEG